MRCILVYKADGSVAIIHPAPKSRKVYIDEVEKFFRITPEQAKELDPLLIVENERGLFRRETFKNVEVGHKVLKELLSENKEIKYTYEPEDEWIGRVYEKSTADTIGPDGEVIVNELKGLNYEVVPVENLPDHTYRNCWRGAKGQGVAVDVTLKAKHDAEFAIKEQIKKDKEEEERNAKSKAIDRLVAEGKITAEVGEALKNG